MAAKQIDLASSSYAPIKLCLLPAPLPCAGETVAAKEIDLASSQLKQEAFITEALRLQQLRWAVLFSFPSLLGMMQWVGSVEGASAPCGCSSSGGLPAAACIGVG